MCESKIKVTYNNLEKERGHKETLVRVLTVVLGVTFVVSCLLKVISIRTFAMEVGEYMDLYMPKWLHGWNMPCAIGVCASELLVGVLAFWKKHVRWMSILSLVMLTFFVWLTGVNLFFPTMFGSVESCGCFGELVHFTPVGSFVKSMVLWVLALVLFVLVHARFMNNPKR